jgi:hypothetical protein
MSVGKYSSHDSVNQTLPEDLNDLEIFARKVDLEFSSLFVQLIFPHWLDF